MEFLDIYNKLRNVPEEAKKTITGGRLSGMTDIRPMWRIEKLTETFGPCGIGWKTIIKNKEIIDGANDEKIAIVDIDLYIKVDGEWSEAIEGTGGSSYIAKEKNGLYTNDECFKMAYTDALSVACKSLGMGADVYWGDSKYDTEKKEATEEDAKNWEFTFGKYKGSKMQDILEQDLQYVNWFINNKASEYDKKCYELLSGEKLPTDEEMDQRIAMINSINALVLETDTDYEDLYKHFKVTTLNQLTIAQLKECGQILKKKLEKKEKGENNASN